MKKLLMYIFIPVLAVLLMSHNSHALNVNFENYTVISTSSSPVGYCTDMSGTQYNFPCNMPPNAQDRVVVRQIRTNNNGYELKQGDIIEFYITVYTNADKDITDGTIGLLDFRPLNYPNIINLNVEEVQSYNFLHFISIGVESLTDLFAQAQFFRTYKITQYVATDGTYNVGLNPSNYLIDWYTSSSNTTRMNLHELTFYRVGESKENKEVEQKTQDAANNSQSSGNSSQSNSQNATSSLLSVFTGFASVITNASATNCVINAPLNTSFSNDRLNVDLCALSLPPALGALTSIIAVMVIVPFAISMFNKFVAIMESFQR